MKKVAIIGGGLAGLTAARLLQAARVDFLLIEARDRLGGRILSAGADGLPNDDGFDLGPSWYWPHMQPAMAELIEELNLRAFCQNSEGDVIFERMSRETAQRYRGAGLEQQSMRLVGGTSALVRALARDIPQNRIRTGACVTAMALLPHGVQLIIDQTETLTAQHVIAALPPRLLEATLTFAPDLSVETARRWQDTPTWMAPHAKFFALYDRPFWRDAGLSGAAQSIVGPMVEMHDATTASGGAALFGFLGVGAEQRAMLGEAALTSACISQFTRIFGPEAQQPTGSLLKDWASDPLTATQMDRSASGHIIPDGLPWVTGEWQKRLTLAGSETSPSEAGYLAGAVTAARLAVVATLDLLNDA